MPEADLDDVEKLVEMIAESKKPMLICGGGVVRSRPTRNSGSLSAGSTRRWPSP